MTGAAPASTTLYFAYGSNMDPAQMARRCPGARALGRASLAGHVFRINHRGGATVVPAAAGVVQGVLWLLDATHVAILDRYEGVAAGTYEKRRVTVQADTLRDALVYVATEWRSGVPRPGYLERIVAGAVHFGLPADYVTRLEAWKTDACGQGEAK